MTATVLKAVPSLSEEEVRARELASDYRDAPANVILERALHDLFKDDIAVVSSFGAESAVLLHMVAQINPDTPVVFLDTQKHFAQTLSYRRKLATQLGLTAVHDIKPDAEAVKAVDPRGDLWRSDADRCCDLRKVRPLRTALDGYSAWISGRKGFQSAGRMALPAFEWNGQHFKVNPLVQWSQEDVKTYAEQHDLPPHPLVEQGFPSIGCWPCTQPVAEGEDARSGRWSGSDKVECGIHGR